MTRGFDGKGKVEGGLVEKGGDVKNKKNPRGENMTLELVEERDLVESGEK